MTNLRCFRRWRVAEVKYWTRAHIDVNEMLKTVSGVGRGGTAVFLGSVRSGPEDGQVVRIEYTAYEPMVEAEFGRIVDESKRRWPETKVSAIHRLGAVLAGEASIAVIAGSPHRAEAFAACRYVIEEAKKRLPVWKKEILADGRESWRPNRVDDTWSHEPSAEAVRPS